MIKEFYLKYKVTIFYTLLTLLVVSIPFPDYSLPSKILIALVVYWFFYNSFSEKLKNLKQNLKPFLLVSLLFMISIIGLIYSGDLSTAIVELQHKILLFIIPLIIFSTPINNEFPVIALKYFTYSVIITSLMAVFKVFYLKNNYYGNFSYYGKFAVLTEKHTTYFALFIILAILYLLYDFLVLKSHHYFITFIAALFLIFVLYMVSNRISLIALIISLAYLTYFYASSKQKYLLIISLSALTFLLFNSPHFQKRFNQGIQQEGVVNKKNDRVRIWSSVLKTIKHNPILIGKGTGGDRTLLYEYYKQDGLKSAYNEQYNAHNQFLETVLDFGIIGLLLFLMSIFFIWDIFRKNQDSLAISILIILIIFMMTESILERQSGLIIFSVFLSLFLGKNYFYNSIRTKNEKV